MQMRLTQKILSCLEIFLYIICDAQKILNFDNEARGANFTSLFESIPQPKVKVIEFFDLSEVRNLDISDFKKHMVIYHKMMCYSLLKCLHISPQVGFIGS
jgi:hypothetical protein